MGLTTRFKNYTELTEREKKQRMDNFHFVNLSGNDLKPLIRERFRPVLKQCGFRGITDSLFYSLSPPHYVHYLQVRFNSVYRGRFWVKAGIALDIVPLSGSDVFTAKDLDMDSDCLFTKVLTLPNGNPEFDNGTNLVEANETIDHLIASFQVFDGDYFQRFTHFPAPVDALGPDFVQWLSDLDSNNGVSEYGSYGATIEYFTYRLALVHKYLDNAPTSRALLDYGLSNYPLGGLRAMYDRLLNDIEANESV